ncbi:MAG: hypothetical protein VX335_01415 [Pseudomonadota bacterium]|nr:hypothetical protein [Pseudomonadota bacterium]
MDNNLKIENENYGPLMSVNDHIDKISYEDIEKMCEKMYLESDEYLKMKEQIDNLENRFNNLGKSSKTDDKYYDFRYSWALLGLAVLLFIVYINWATISAAAIYAASFLQTMSWAAQFGIAFTVSSCLVAGTITFITMKKPKVQNPDNADLNVNKEEMPVKGPSSIVSTDLQANTNLSPIKKTLSTYNDCLNELTVEMRG